MTEGEKHKFAQLLEQVKLGDADARKRLISIIYPELRLIAQRIMSRDSANYGLSRTGSALTNELYICRLGTDAAFRELARAKDYVDVLRIARRDMKLLLMEAFSRMLSLPLKDAMEELERIKPDAAYAIELNYGLGLTTQESAAGMGLCARAFREIHAYGKAWLRDYLGGASATA